MSAVFRVTLFNVNLGATLCCSPSDYHFTAPVRGLYWFTVSVAAQNLMRVDLTLNGQSIAGANDADPAGGDAVSAILMLQAGDRVSCRKALSSYTLMEETGSPNHSFNTFAGFLYVEL